MRTLAPAKRLFVNIAARADERGQRLPPAEPSEGAGSGRADTGGKVVLEVEKDWNRLRPAPDRAAGIGAHRRIGVLQERHHDARRQIGPEPTKITLDLETMQVEWTSLEGRSVRDLGIGD